MGTLKAEAVADKAFSDPGLDTATGADDLRNATHASSPEPNAADLADATREGSADSAPPDGAAKQSSIKRSIVSFLQPSVAPANDDRASSGRARRAAQSRRLKYGALLLASALLLIGAVYSLAQSDRFVTDLTVVSFVLILFFLIGLRIEATQGMLRDLSELVETRSVGLDVGVDIDAAEHKVGVIDAAVARTLDRAGELQTVLRSEDLDFEKAYGLREERFRAVLEDMAVERAAITTNAEKMRLAMEGAHQNLSNDLDAASRRFALLLTDTGSNLMARIEEQLQKQSTNAEKTRLAMESAHQNLSNDLDAASRRFTSLLTDTGSNLMARIEEQLQKQSTDAIEVCIKKLRSSLDGALIRAVEQVDSRGATLAGLISTKSEEFDEKLLNFKKEVALSLNGQIDDTQKAAAIRIEAMTGSINRLLDRMNSGIAERSESLNQMLATRVLEIASTLKAGRTEMLQTIEAAASLSSDMSNKSQVANELLQKQIAQLNETVVNPLDGLVEGLKNKSTSLTHELAEQFDSVDDALKIQSRDLSTLFERHIARLKETLATTSATIEGVVENNNAVYESSLETLFKRHHRPLSDEMASVRSEFAAQRKLLAPLITNFSRSERTNGVSVSSEPREIGPSHRAAPSVASTSLNDEAGRRDDAPRAVQRAVDIEATRVVEPTRVIEAENKAGQSWLTDILARASSAEEPIPADDEDEIDANIFSAISTNIESLVSSEKVAAAWTAFKKREVSRFHQIYTPQGEVVFGKLRALLDADEELSESVSKYAAQFESLLRERFDDEDERALLRYLGTPTGKVYTMLAHASNRLS